MPSSSSTAGPGRSRPPSTPRRCCPPPPRCSPAWPTSAWRPSSSGRDRRAARPHGHLGCRRGRHRLACPLDEARRRVGGLAVQGNLDPRCASHPSTWWPPRPGRSWRRPARPRGISSTLGTASSPRPTRGSSPSWSPRPRGGSSGCGGGAGAREGSMSTDRQPGTKPIGVLVMAHGTPSRPDDVEAFYTRIRRGSPPSPEQLAELTGRYEAIGGISPLAERTAGQVDGLAPPSRPRTPAASSCAMARSTPSPPSSRVRRPSSPTACARGRRGPHPTPLDHGVGRVSAARH